MPLDSYLPCDWCSITRSARRTKSGTEVMQIYRSFMIFCMVSKCCRRYIKLLLQFNFIIKRAKQIGQMKRKSIRSKTLESQIHCIRKHEPVEESFQTSNLKPVLKPQTLSRERLHIYRPLPELQSPNLRRHSMKIISYPTDKFECYLVPEATNALVQAFRDKIIWQRTFVSKNKNRIQQGVARKLNCNRLSSKQKLKTEPISKIFDQNNVKKGKMSQGISIKRLPTLNLQYEPQRSLKSLLLHARQRRSTNK